MKYKILKEFPAIQLNLYTLLLSILLLFSLSLNTKTVSNLLNSNVDPSFSIKDFGPKSSSLHYPEYISEKITLTQDNSTWTLSAPWTVPYIGFVDVSVSSCHYSENTPLDLVCHNLSSSTNFVLLTEEITTCRIHLQFSRTSASDLNLPFCVHFSLKEGVTKSSFVYSLIGHWVSFHLSDSNPTVYFTGVDNLNTTWWIRVHNFVNSTTSLQTSTHNTSFSDSSVTIAPGVIFNKTYVEKGMHRVTDLGNTFQPIFKFSSTITNSSGQAWGVISAIKTKEGISGVSFVGSFSSLSIVFALFSIPILRFFPKNKNGNKK